MTRKLIERFFNDECDEAERQKVISLLKDDSQLFDEYLSEIEWNNFIKNEKLNPKISKKIFNKINRQTNTKSKIIPLIKKIAIAACIILVTGLGWKYFPNQDHMEELAIKESKTKIVDTLNHIKK